MSYDNYHFTTKVTTMHDADYELVGDNRNILLGGGCMVIFPTGHKFAGPWLVAGKGGQIAESIDMGPRLVRRGSPALRTRGGLNRRASKTPPISSSAKSDRLGNRNARRARARTTDERGFDVLGSCLATVPAKQLRQRARERTKTRVSLAGQIHCGYLTQLHVGAGPVRE